MTTKHVLLDMRKLGVRQARQHPCIRNKPLMGRGVFSAVFNKHRSVAKLTLDPLSYALLSNEKLSRNPHFPSAHTRYGIVGKQEEQLYLYLVEMERLKPVDAFPSLYRPITQLLNRIEEVQPYDPRYYPEPTADAEAIRYAARHPDNPRNFRKALLQLADFIDTYNANLDLHHSNFMVRPATRELVINDPVVDASLYHI